MAPKIDPERPSKVSQGVFNDVCKIARSEKSPEKIDSPKEYDRLSEYLSNGMAEGKLNKDDCDFINAQLKEYEEAQKKKEEKEFMSYVHDKTKALVKRYAAGVGANKTKIDAPIEASGLLAELSNPQNDFNDYDRKYILKVVQESGVLPGFGIGCSAETNKIKNDNEPTSAIQIDNTSEQVKNSNSKRGYNEKQLGILQSMAKAILLSASGEGVVLTVQKTVELLRDARVNGLEDTKEYELLEKTIQS